MKPHRLIAFSLLGPLAVAAAFALESLALYDDFSSGKFDPKRWSGGGQSNSITGDAMRLTWRGWGQTQGDSGTEVSGRSQSISRGLPVTQLRASVRVGAIEATGCAANAAATRVVAGVAGKFFSTGNRTAGSNLGNVVALLTAGRESTSVDPPGVLRVEGRVYMCQDADCESLDQLGPTASLGNADVGVFTLLQLEWDRANNRFLFSRDKGEPVAVDYTVDDSADPGDPWKGLITLGWVANCASGPRAIGAIDAKFDNVAVNASARP